MVRLAHHASNHAEQRRGAQDDPELVERVAHGTFGTALSKAEGLLQKFAFLILIVVLVMMTVRQNNYWCSEISLFERALQFERLGRVHLLLARAYYFDHQYENSIKEYKTALGIMRDYAKKTRDNTARKFYLGFIKGIYFDLAHCYEALGNLKEAVNTYKLSLEIDPRDSVILNNLAADYLGMDQVEAAQEILIEILVLNPTDINAMTNLALCYINQDQFAKAESLLREALKINSQFTPARQNLERLLQSQAK